MKYAVKKNFNFHAKTQRTQRETKNFELKKEIIFHEFHELTRTNEYLVRKFITHY
jgi:hypothetical protein